ncbi:MAG: hypothetical protein HY900_22475 [Deltaproteobacteria bacterium]|nr:hypothetical protein [Deltaproteobacteria bacterium]
MRYMQRWFSVYAVVLLLAACGGGGGGGGPLGGGGDGGGGDTSTAKVSFSVANESGGALGAPVQGVILTVAFPEGVTVATEPGSTSIASQSLSVGKDLTSPHRIISGSFSGGVARIAVATPEEPVLAAGGELEIAELTVTHPSAAPPNPAALALSIPQAVGYSRTSQSTVDITAALQASAEVKTVP